MDLLKLSTLAPSLLGFLKNLPTSIWRDQRAFDRIRKKTFYRNNACWINELDGSESGPYCSSCFRSKNIHNEIHETASRGNYRCHIFNSIVQVEKYPEEEPKCDPIIEYLNRQW